MTIIATVTSRPTRDRAVIDAGFRSISGREGVLPRLVGMRGVEVAYLSAEHGVLRLAPDAEDLRIGDRVELIPDYSDTTTFRHDQFVALRGDVVERVIPLLARGRLT